MAETKFASAELAAAARSPAIAAGLAARDRGIAAILARDVEAFARGLSAGLVVNTPGNRVSRRDEVIRRFQAEQIRYRSFETTIELIEAAGDLVVIMGEEAVTPMSETPHSGRMVRRRFTDVFRKENDGTWRLAIRQATNISVGA